MVGAVRVGGNRHELSASMVSSRAWVLETQFSVYGGGRLGVVQRWSLIPVLE